MLLAANLRNYSFLARLLILIKKGGLLQLNSGGCGVNMHTYGRDNLKSFSCVLPKFVMLVTRVNSSRTSSILWLKKNQNGRFIEIFRILLQ